MPASYQCCCVHPRVTTSANGGCCRLFVRPGCCLFKLWSAVKFSGRVLVGWKFKNLLWPLLVLVDPSQGSLPLLPTMALETTVGTFHLLYPSMSGVALLSFLVAIKASSLCPLCPLFTRATLHPSSLSSGLPPCPMIVEQGRWSPQLFPSLNLSVGRPQPFSLFRKILVLD